MKERSKATGAGGEGSSTASSANDQPPGTDTAAATLGKNCQEFPNQLSIPFSKLTFPMTKASTPIIDFYKGRSVFITGATGFVGKATVEKILRTCPDVGNVFILVRPKAGCSVAERMEDLLNNSVSTISQNRSSNPGHL